MNRRRKHRSPTAPLKVLNSTKSSFSVIRTIELSVGISLYLQQEVDNEITATSPITTTYITAVNNKNL